MIVLVGDVGGTKTILQVTAVEPDGRRVLAEQRFLSQDYPGLAPLVRSFLAGSGLQIGAACFGVPGPVREGRAQATNLPWRLDQEELQTDLGIGRLQLINDFAAVAHGITELGETERLVLNPGLAEPRAPIAILGAGTGLGEAILFWSGGRYEVLASEGGHTDFAPRNEREIGLLRYLLGRHGRVSYERVLSGPGIVNIYEYLCQSGFAAESPAVRAAMARGDAAAAIAAHATSDILCREAIDIFVAVYGAEAANLALKVLATGGVYVAGGVAPQLAPHFREGPFQKAFLEKGRMGALLEGIPVYLVMNPKVGLLGAAAVAARNS